MINAGSVIATLILDAQQFQQTMTAARADFGRLGRAIDLINEGPVKRLSASLGRLGGALTVGVTAPLTLAGSSAIKVAADFEQVNMAFTSMLKSGERANAFLGQMRDFAAKTPFELPQLLDGSRRLLAFGFAAKTIRPTLTAVGDAVAAMGGGSEMIDGVTRALGQMQAKGKVSAEEMLQLAEQGIPAWKYLATALGVDIPTAMKKVESGTVDAATGIKGILAGMEHDFSGMMDKQSQTVLGRWSTIKDQFREILLNIGETLLPIASLALDLLKPLLTMVNWIVQAFNFLPGPIKYAIVALMGMSAALGPLIFLFSRLLPVMAIFMGRILPLFILAPTLGKVIAYFRTWGPLVAGVTSRLGLLAAQFPILARVGPMLARGWGFISQFLIAMVPGLRFVLVPLRAIVGFLPRLIFGFRATAAGVMGPVGLILLGVTLLSDAVIKLVRNWDKVKAAMQRFWLDLKIIMLTGLKGLLNALVGAGPQAEMGMLSWLPGVREKLLEWKRDTEDEITRLEEEKRTNREQAEIAAIMRHAKTVSGLLTGGVAQGSSGASGSDTTPKPPKEETAGVPELKAATSSLEHTRSTYTPWTPETWAKRPKPRRSPYAPPSWLLPRLPRPPLKGDVQDEYDRNQRAEGSKSAPRLNANALRQAQALQKEAEQIAAGIGQAYGKLDAAIPQLLLPATKQRAQALQRELLDMFAPMLLVTRDIQITRGKLEQAIQAGDTARATQLRKELQHYAARLSGLMSHTERVKAELNDLATNATKQVQAEIDASADQLVASDTRLLQDDLARLKRKQQLAKTWDEYRNGQADIDLAQNAVDQADALKQLESALVGNTGKNFRDLIRESSGLAQQYWQARHDEAVKLLNEYYDLEGRKIRENAEEAILAWKQVMQDREEEETLAETKEAWARQRKQDFEASQRTRRQKLELSAYERSGFPTEVLRLRQELENAQASLRPSLFAPYEEFHKAVSQAVKDKTGIVLSQENVDALKVNPEEALKWLVEWGVLSQSVAGNLLARLNMQLEHIFANYNDTTWDIKLRIHDEQWKEWKASLMDVLDLFAFENTDWKAGFQAGMKANQKMLPIAGGAFKMGLGDALKALGTPDRPFPSSSDLDISSVIKALKPSNVYAGDEWTGSLPAPDWKAKGGEKTIGNGYQMPKLLPIPAQPQGSEGRLENPFEGMPMPEPSVNLQPIIPLPEMPSAPAPNITLPEPSIIPAPALTLPEPSIVPAPSITLPEPKSAPAPTITLPEPSIVPAPNVTLPEPKSAPAPNIFLPEPSVAPAPAITLPEMPAPVISVPVSAESSREQGAAARFYDEGRKPQISMSERMRQMMRTLKGVYEALDGFGRKIQEWGPRDYPKNLAFLKGQYALELPSFAKMRAEVHAELERRKRPESRPPFPFKIPLALEEGALSRQPMNPAIIQPREDADWFPLFSQLRTELRADRLAKQTLALDPASLPRLTPEYTPQWAPPPTAPSVLRQRREDAETAKAREAGEADRAQGKAEITIAASRYFDVRVEKKADDRVDVAMSRMAREMAMGVI